jgi:hypothetical protein
MRGKLLPSVTPVNPHTTNRRNVPPRRVWTDRLREIDAYSETGVASVHIVTVGFYGKDYNRERSYESWTDKNGDKVIWELMDRPSGASSSPACAIIAAVESKPLGVTLSRRFLVGYRGLLGNCHELAGRTRVTCRTELSSTLGDRQTRSLGARWTFPEALRLWGDA